MNNSIACEILNYNDAGTVISLVERIKNYKSLSSIIIVDNCSDDDSLQKLRHKYGNNKKIQIISTKKNGGYGYGNNYGIRFASKMLGYKYVLLANPDIYFDEDSLNEMICTIKENQNVGIVSAVQKTISNKEILDKAWKIPSDFEYIFSDTKISRILKLNSRYSLKHFNQRISKVDCVPGAMLLIDADKFLKVGGYDEEMFLYCEETTLGYKFKEKGYSTLLLNDVSYNHLQSESIKKSIPSIVKQRKLIYKNRLLFLKKYKHIGRIKYFIAKHVYLHIIKKIG